MVQITQPVIVYGWGNIYQCAGKEMAKFNEPTDFYFAGQQIIDFSYGKKYFKQIVSLYHKDAPNLLKQIGVTDVYSLCNVGFKTCISVWNPKDRQ